LDKWKSLEATKRYLDACTRKWGISENQLVTSRMGNPESGGGTWIHEKLILNAARYISVDFELWCDEKLSEMVRTGSVTLQPAKAPELEKHIYRPIQVENSKQVNHFNFAHGGVQRTKEYNQKNCYEHTGKFPNELIREAKEAGVPSKNRSSGKEVIRYYNPGKAASMSLTDELCKRGTIGVTEAANLCKPAIPLFDEMIRQGLLTQ